MKGPYFVKSFDYDTNGINGDSRPSSDIHNRKEKLAAKYTAVKCKVQITVGRRLEGVLQECNIFLVAWLSRDFRVPYYLLVYEVPVSLYVRFDTFSKFVFRVKKSLEIK